MAHQLVIAMTKKEETEEETYDKYQHRIGTAIVVVGGKKECFD
jgi:hypothetical protein